MPKTKSFGMQDGSGDILICFDFVCLTLRPFSYIMVMRLVIG